MRQRLPDVVWGFLAGFGLGAALTTLVMLLGSTLAGAIEAVWGS